MNQLETNLALWAICSILLFEILIIICLCRCCFNRIRPKKFYVKREEYEYLQDIHIGTQSKFQSTILRPPHADELALIGTIRGQKSLISYNDGFQNIGFSRDNENERILRLQPSSSQNWIELQPNMLKTAQLPPADYEIHSYPTDDYYYSQPHPSSRPNILDVRQIQQDYIDDTNELESFQYQPLRRPDIILPQAQRLDTSTEFYGIHFANTVPKSILKTGTNTTPPIDLSSNLYSQTHDSRTSSKYDESPYISVKINTDQSIPIDYPMSAIEKRISDELIPSPNLSLASKHRMKFASVSKLNDIEWEVPREFQNIVQDNQTFCSDRQRTSSAIVDSKSHISWQREMNITQPFPLLPDDLTQQQQQAFEY
ncbi:unnamed protein product [Adineta steineri]|uniref:Uncharacterized protein n=1 Tax=Adineta steineri TaxID=433720 RepID=A0A814UP42_9BILA|nr:unnamed protein product [Adineta steineri]CAF3641123.1 unnamed protein product [Adineta steineri]